MTEPATIELMELLEHQIPQRWSVAHLYQDILDGAEYVKDLDDSVTLKARDWKGWDNYGSTAIVESEKIDTSNKSCVKIQTCFVIYKTNIKDLNFNQNTKVTVNISSRDYYSIELNDLEEEKKSKFSEYI